MDGKSFGVKHWVKANADVVYDSVAGVRRIGWSHCGLEICSGEFDVLFAVFIEDVDAFSKIDCFHSYSFHVNVRNLFSPTPLLPPGAILPWCRHRF